MGGLQRGVRIAAFAALAFLSVLTPAAAVNPDEMLQDPALEARARELSAELRCLVCRNQSIDDSNAELARDLRLLVRERITAGDTNEQAKAYIVARYGNFVLLKPPYQWNTAALWVGPALFLVVVAFGAFRWVRLRSTENETPEATPPLSAEEQARADAMLAEKGST
jgi:cytochrome c-type biogenesis protein CcmH